MPRSVRHLMLTLAIAVLAGCGSDAPPASKTADKDQHTELRDAIQRPLNRAKAVDDVVKKAKQQQDKDIENQLNGQAPDDKSGDDKSGSH